MDYGRPEYSPTSASHSSGTSGPPYETSTSHDSGSISPELGRHAGPASNPFTSQSQSTSHSSSAARHHQGVSRRYFHSRRVKKGEVEKPWTKQKEPREKWVTLIPLIGIVVGLAIAGFLIYDGLRTVVNHVYCPVLDEDFSNGLDTDIWYREAEVGGFGNGQFEQTTNTDENVFVEDGMMVIKPTLQDASLIEQNHVINLTADGICSSDLIQNCVAVTNTTNGTIVPPVKSGRVSTRDSHSIRYGRVEVTAQLPSGDWLWPAIWMLPSDPQYGEWPQSGEIDIVESRGNNHSYAQGGNNIISSALHWGPDLANDAWWRTNVKRQALHTTYASKFHTFGIEWSEKYLFTYIDSRLLQVLYVNFDDQPLWQRGEFPPSNSNGTRLVDPWSHTGNYATPFDQDFYLIMNIAVGGTNGWFEDGMSSKPWADGSTSAALDFWQARDRWYPTWQQQQGGGSPEGEQEGSGGGGAQMKIKRVKMWQQQGYNGC